MTLPPGTRLGAYEVTSQIGEGGMGEVYKATDTNLKRAVALKVLPAALAADVERLARFQREAEVLGSLNHPNIAQIYGLEKNHGLTALVMELVEGEDLSRRIARRPLPIDEVLPIAKQIAEALESAHERGIIHRDLKPANIKVRTDGTVKVLDFGLAKAMDSGAGNREPGSGAGAGEIANSPTMTTPAMTQAGMILGTAAYMSPEQAKGRVLDKRSDIWSFGCVLFEMLSGQRAFAGDDVTDTLAAIIRADPDWALLPANLPRSLRAIVEGCLKKDRQQRIGDIAVVQFLLNDPNPVATVATLAVSTPAASRLWKAVAALLLVTTLGAGVAAVYLSRPQSPPAITRFLIDAPEKSAFVTAGRTGTSVAISPDGRRLAYTQRDEAGKILVWIRALDALTAQPLPGTESAEFPFWSPDSQWLGYFAGGKLLKINAGGGPPQTICSADGARGGTWGPQGEIVYGGGTGNGLTRVSAGGGEPVAFTKPKDGDHRFPSFLPDGHHVLFYFQSPGLASVAGLYLASLDSGEIKRLAASDSTGVYAQPGFVLFTRQTALVAQPFDLISMSVTGDAVPVAERVESGVFGGVVAFSVSNTGTLAYGIGSGRGTNLQLTWLDRQGKAIQTIGQPGNYFGIELSPDGKQLAAHRHDFGTGGDLWLVDMVRGATSRFTFDPAQDNASPVWSPDGKRIAFTSLRSGVFAVYVKPSNGTGAEQHVTVPGPASPRSWSPDGQFLAYGVIPAGGGLDAWSLPISGAGKPEPLLASTFWEGEPTISPDGKWLAYTSDETGTNELYVRPFPRGEGKWQVSTGGGGEPRWRGDSKELFYMDRPQLGSLMAVDVRAAGPLFSAGTPRRLFGANMLAVGGHPGPSGWWRYDVARDGQRFLLALNPRATSFGDTSSPMAVVVNWAAGLKK